MSKDVKFNIKLSIDGKEHIVEATTDVKHFAQELGIAETKGKRLRDSLLKFNGLVTLFQGLQSSIQQVTGVAQTYIDANKIQVEAETKLMTVMKQRMNATDDEIQSVKDLASAQQALGVIGDEVQLSGVQQLSTFLSQKDSIDKLLPAMNNLLAQQHGLNVTTGDAVNVGNLMGKVMQGQVSALTRVGITFTEAQEQVLKFGTESERAAMLAQVITDNVGEMNQALAQTDAGKAKQELNDLGDKGEVVGAFISKYEKYIAAFSQLTVAASSAITVYKGIEGAIDAAGIAMGGWGNASRKMAGLVKNLIAGMRSFILTGNASTAAMNGMTVAANTSAVAIRGLMVATGVGIAIAGLTAAIAALVSASSEATGGTSALERAQKRANDQYGEEAAKIQALNSIIHDHNVNTDTRIAKLNELKQLVPDYNAEISKEGDILNENTAALNGYLDALKKKIYLQSVEEELTAKLKEQYAAEKEVEKKQATADKVKEQGNIRERRPVFGSAEMDLTSYDKQFQQQMADAAVQQAKDKVEAIKKEITALQEEYSKIGNTPEASGSAGNQIPVYLKVQTNKQDFDKAIAHYREQLETASEGEAKRLTRRIADLEQRRAKFLGQSSGKATASGTTATPATDEARPYLEAQHTLEDYDKAIAYHRELQRTASQEGYQEHQKEIQALEEARKAFTGETKPEYAPAPVEQLNTVRELTDAIHYYEDVQREQSDAEAVDTQRTIDLLQAKLDKKKELLTLPAIQKETSQLQGLSAPELKSKLELVGLDEAKAKLEALKKMLDTAPEGQRKEIEKLIPVWQNYVDTLQSGKKENTDATQVMGTLSQGMSQFGQAVGGAAGQWLQWGSNLMSAVAAAIPAIMALTQAKQEETTANTAAAASGAASSVASIPVVGAVMAVAAIASVIAAMANVPKFAKGGVVSGPTLALVGEYGGASNNPEVIAPLDKLRGIIGEASPGLDGNVVFRIDGTTLLGVLRKVERRNART